MSQNPVERLCRDRSMLPILFEPDVGFDVLTDITIFKRELRGKLQQLVRAKDPISEGLFEQLLPDRRVVVIVDGISEMLRGCPGPVTVRPANPDFPINALIFTSREIENFNEEVNIRPQRIDSTHLLGFINSYLTADWTN